MSRRVFVLGLPVDTGGEGAALSRVEGLVDGGGRHQVITANALMLLSAQKNPALRSAFVSADLVVPDSVGVAWALRRAGVRGAPVPGIDLMDGLCRRAAARGWRVYFLGAAPGVARRAAARLQARHPGLRVAGVEHGHFSVDQETAVCERVFRAAPDLLFVALDTPRQDGWIHRHRTRLGARVVMGVGGSFDVWAGRLRRAPAWMSRAGLEWFFRLIQEPRRAARMSRLPWFVWKVLTEGVK